MSRKLRRNQQGFTIIELMVATSVMSVMLVMVTFIMINIGNLYYKGINQSRIQTAARNLSDDLKQHLQLSDGLRTGADPAQPGVQAICIGDTRYTYILNRQVDGSSHALWRDRNTTPGSCTFAALPNMGAATPSPGGVELIPARSRLVEFSVTGSSPYNISIGMAYGDDNVLCNSSVGGDCALETDSTELHNPGHILCKGRQGTAFCATSYLQSTVVKRLY